MAAIYPKAEVPVVQLSLRRVRIYHEDAFMGGLVVSSFCFGAAANA